MYKYITIQYCLTKYVPDTWVAGSKYNTLLLLLTFLSHLT